MRLPPPTEETCTAAFRASRPPSRGRGAGAPLRIGAAILLIVWAANAWAEDDGSDAKQDAYRTPRAGEAYTARIFGREVRAPARDLRKVFALDLGLAATIPNTGGIPVVPIGAFFVFWRPDDEQFADAVIAGFQNDVLAAWSPRRMGHFEIVGTLRSSTIPAARSEIIQGEQRKAIEIKYGSVNVGVGLGYRRQVGLTVEDMMAFSLTVEPGYRYFERGDDTAASFEVPPDTFEILVRARFRYDDFERNLMSLIHAGFGFGAEAVYGHRGKVSSWGIDGLQDGADGQDFGLVRGYLEGARGVPFVESERQRVTGAVHFGAGVDLDRFSAPRIGGGPDADQFRAIRRPVIPGAALGEFYPDSYVIMQGEYRYELAFFSYLGVRGSVSNISANAESTPTQPEGRRWLSSIGARWTSGFVFHTRMRLAYDYNFNVIRDGSSGGHAILFDLSREF